MQKSAIFFGKGSTEESKEQLKAVIGINSEALSEKYLGLPTAVGKSKEGTFKYARESAKGKVTGWKGQGLSKKARDVLVKSGLQSTPTFTMSCFQLTKKLCGNLTSISSNFWWGEANGEKKVHWIAWQKMCASKREGGMGFCDMEVFNQALLESKRGELCLSPLRCVHESSRHAILLMGLSSMQHVCVVHHTPSEVFCMAEICFWTD